MLRPARTRKEVTSVRATMASDLPRTTSTVNVSRNKRVEKTTLCNTTIQYTNIL